MKPLVAAILALGLLFISGCKIRIEVPAGGSISTQSGAFQCNAGQTCDIDVSDLFFDETFVATPAPGYRFRHWQQRHRGFCGGNAGPCRLFTSGFAGNDTLLGFLESDEVFFLTPVFETIEPGPLGTQNASICFNADIVAQGAQLFARYRAAVGAGTQVSVFDQRVQGTGTFNGNSGVRLVIDQEVRGPGGSRALVESIVAVDAANSQLRRFGFTAEGQPPQIFSQTLTYSPFLLTRFDLGPGQSYTQSFSSLIEDGQGFSDESVTELTTTYLGTEALTVAAGTFQTCRFREQGRVTNSMGAEATYSLTLWYGVGNGVLLRNLSESSDSELVAGSINGVPL